MIQRLSQNPVKSVEVKNEFKIYPNPTSQYVIIEGINKSTFEYNVVNTLGQTVLKGKSSSDKLIIDLSHFVPGVYFVTYSTATPYNTQTQKVILK